jgi:hypothetical protein
MCLCTYIVYRWFGLRAKATSLIIGQDQDSLSQGKKGWEVNGSWLYSSLSPVRPGPEDHHHHHHQVPLLSRFSNIETLKFVSPNMWELREGWISALFSTLESLGLVSFQSTYYLLPCVMWCDAKYRQQDTKQKTMQHATGLQIYVLCIGTCT